MTQERPFAITFAVVLMVSIAGPFVFVGNVSAAECNATESGYKFCIESYTITETTYNGGEQVSVEATISNRGEAIGTTEAILGVRDPSDSKRYPDRQSVEIPRGETERVTLTYTLPSDATTGTYDVTVDLRTPPGNHLFDTTGFSKSFDVKEASGPGAVRGTVTDNDGNPISGAKVYLDDRTDTRTGSDGSYEFSSVEPGTHTVEVVNSGYGSASKQVSVTSNEPTTQNFELTPETFTVELASEPISVNAQGEGTYDYGADVSFSAPSEQDGYTFQHWEDQDGEIVSEDREFTIDYITTDYDIVAQYKEPGQPDLKVSDVSWEPNNPTAGDSVVFYATVVNDGEARAATFDAQVQLDEGDTGRIFRAEDISLAPGESKRVELGTWTAKTVPEQLTAEVDPAEEVDEEDETNNELTKSIAIEDQRPAFEELSFEIVSVNGEPRNSEVVSVEHAFVESITVEATDQNGDSISNLSLALNNRISPKSGISVKEIEEGKYRFTGSPAIGSGMTVQKYNISLAGKSDKTRAIELQVRDPELLLSGPIEGWVAYSQVTVTVDNEAYTAVRMQTYRPEKIGGPYGWVIYDSEGNLVTDPQLQRQAGKTAVVSRLTRNEQTWEQFFGEEYPENIDTFLGGDLILQGAVSLRDAAAYTLGVITFTVQTGGVGGVKAGTQAASKLSTKQAMKVTSRAIMKKTVKNLAEGYSTEQVKENPKAAMKGAIRYTARMQLLQSREESQQAAQVLREHPDDEPWSHEDAKVVWNMMNESLVEGNMWMALRANSAPGGPVWEQTDDVLVEFASGYSGAPISSLYELSNAFRKKSDVGIQQSLEETASIRQSFHQDYQSYAEIGPSLTTEIKNKYGTQSGEVQESRTQKSAAIEIVSSPSGKYTVEETVETTVRVTNTGDEAARFFAGYSVGTTVGGDMRYYDNRDRTGRFITLDSGESETVDLQWSPQHSAPDDSSYNVVVAIWSGFPSSDTARLDEQRQTDSFTLTTGGEIAITDTTIPESGTTTEPVPVDITVENTGKRTDHKLVRLTENEQVIASEMVVVGPESSQTTTLNVSFSEAGTHTVNIAGASTAIQIADDGSPSQSGEEDAGMNDIGAANESNSSDTRLDQTGATNQSDVSSGSGNQIDSVAGAPNETGSQLSGAANGESLAVAAAGSQTIDGNNVRLSFEIKNTGDEAEAVLLNIGPAVSNLPGHWEIVNRTDNGGVWRESKGTLLFQSVSPGETVEPSVTISPPQDANGEYTPTFEASTNESSTSVRVNFTIQDRSVVEAVDRNQNGKIEDGEILDAIEWWRTDESVPDTQFRISNQQILQLLDLWQEGGAYR